jgi:hypothetical protein
VLVRPAAVSEAALNGTLLNCASGAIPIEYAGRSAIHSALVARQVVVAQFAFLLKLLALCVESITARVYAEPLRETEALILSPGATDVPGCALGA